MIIQISPTDTSISYKCDWQFAQMENNPETANGAAEHYAVFFMAMDKLVFGYTKFNITDSNLFRTAEHGKALQVKISSNSSNNNLYDIIELCEEMVIWYEDCQYADTDACSSGCDRCQLCMQSFVMDYCWEEYVWTGGGETGGGTGSTGGGGTPTPPNPCNGTPDNPQPFARGNVDESNIVDPCNGGGGGIPIIPIDDNPTIFDQISIKLSLSNEEQTWLHGNQIIAEEILNFLEEAKANENPLNFKAYNLFEDPQALMAARATLKTAQAGLINSGFSQTHFNFIVSNLPTPANNTNYNPLFDIWFTICCINTKLEHPEWSNARVYLAATLEVVHILLDVGGMVPVIGEVADLTNGVIYTIQGDGVNATFSYFAAMPITGWASTTSKYARKLIIAVDGSKRTLNWFKDAAGIISFGDRGLLRKVLGLAKGDARVAHHLIPWEHCDKGIIQKAAKGDFNMNEFVNGIPLTTTQHSGSHGIYNDKLRDKLQSLLNQSELLNWNNNQCAIAVRKLANDLKNWIVAHPNESINNIVIP
ncbi:MAG: AHH domain-containing protein [Niastella sp.]|nr:AHH domain-containing protein [Niastella sp.]